ncbi:enoyl-CoA delta isomerase 2 isoform X1 [Anabrus simplex]|uniref:enoyl-CoA delta isomerase 2 isoform X1 n=1 Tax=Anabrus simplex TaxID=316456 RepID=UPI0035A2C0D4
MGLVGYQHLNVTIRNGLKIIRFNRPSKKNAINSKMYLEIKDALEESIKDESVVITALTGTGEYYSSGNDISSFAEFAQKDIDVVIQETSMNLQFSLAFFQDVLHAAPASRASSNSRNSFWISNLRKFISVFIDFPKILVAVVNGPAIGIAATTLGLCDIVYASDKASFSTPFTSLGLSAEGCSTYTFPRIMGSSLAGEMLYFNRRLSAVEAKQCGLVSTIFPNESLAQEIWPKLEEMAQLPVKSLLYTKRLLRRWDSESLHKACAAECKQLEERWQSEDCLNAVANFLQRRSKL